jgi:hypothetical protein
MLLTLQAIRAVCPFLIEFRKARRAAFLLSAPTDVEFTCVQVRAIVVVIRTLNVWGKHAKDHSCSYDAGDRLDGYALRVRKDERQFQFRLLPRWDKSTGHHQVPKREAEKIDHFSSACSWAASRGGHFYF